MLDTQSTFALPNRLTQIALYPNLNQYLREVDNAGHTGHLSRPIYGKQF